MLRFGNAPCVKIVLLNDKSSQYLKNLTSWTSNLSEAFDFGGVSAAVDFCRDFNWEEIKVLLIPEPTPS